VTIGWPLGSRVSTDLAMLSGLALAELEQEARQVDAEIFVVEALDPSAVAAVSLAAVVQDVDHQACGSARVKTRHGTQSHRSRQHLLM
jgi:hypothetical protein